MVEVGQRAFEIPEGVASTAPVVVGGEMSRIDRQGLIEVVQGAGVIALRLPRRAAIVIERGGGLPGRDLECSIEVDQRAGNIAQGLACETTVAVGIAETRRQLKRLIE